MLTHSSAKRKRIYAWPRSPLAGHMVRQTRMWSGSRVKEE